MNPASSSSATDMMWSDNDSHTIMTGLNGFSSHTPPVSAGSTNVDTHDSGQSRFFPGLWLPTARRPQTSAATPTLTDAAHALMSLSSAYEESNSQQLLLLEYILPLPTGNSFNAVTLASHTRRLRHHPFRVADSLGQLVPPPNTFQWQPDGSLIHPCSPMKCLWIGGEHSELIYAPYYSVAADAINNYNKFTRIFFFFMKLSNCLSYIVST